MSTHTPRPGSEVAVCTCGEVERPIPEAIIYAGQDGSTHRFDGLPCFVDSKTETSPGQEGAWEETPGVWAAWHEGELVAVGPDPKIISSVYESYRKHQSPPGEPHDPKCTGVPPTCTPGCPYDVGDSIPHHIDCSAGWTPDGRWLRDPPAHQRAAGPDPASDLVSRDARCDLGDCSDAVAGVVTITVPSVGEDPLPRTLAVCSGHLRLIQSGAIIGFSFVPDYRDDLL